MNSSNKTAIALDRQDILAHKKQEFILPEGIIYLDGNSLGPLTYRAKRRAEEVINVQWGLDLITSWNKHQWIDLPATSGAKIARLIGANASEVVCCDSTSINLFKVLSHCLSLQSGRNKIVSQSDNFPTDLYIAEGLSTLVGQCNCELVSVADTDLMNTLDDKTAILFLTQVNFRTGFIHDIEMITQRAHELGVIVVWDLAHSAGVIPLAMNDWDVDFAIGCGYKYLNGGPGAPAFVYANQRFHDSLHQPLTGWMGHASPFDFTETYRPAPNINQFLAGTPAVVSMSIMDAALDIFEDLDIVDIRRKSLQLTDYFSERMATSEILTDLNSVSPTEHKVRGSQLSFAHEHAYAICQALISVGVIADFRAPNILRIGFSPLYLSFADLDYAISQLEHVMDEQLFLKHKFQRRNAVT